MIEYNRGELGRAAKERGFVRDTFEKALRLKEILADLNADAFISEHLALKGGTAINMTVFNLPRLSVDIDMDFTPNLRLEEMTDVREKITDYLIRYMEKEGYRLSPASKYTHSLDSFVFQYINAGGNKDNIKVELNYSLRAHIFAPVKRKMITDAFDEQPEIRTLEPMELFAAKANALMSRAAARDLYDFSNMIRYGLFDESQFALFRKCIVFYASISSEHINKDFDTAAIEGLTFLKIRRDLFPVLRQKDKFDLKEQKNTAREFIKELMRLTPEEKEYLEAFERKEYKPELLFEDAAVLENIKEHPMALWKQRLES